MLAKDIAAAAVNFKPRLPVFHVMIVMYDTGSVTTQMSRLYLFTAVRLKSAGILYVWINGTHRGCWMSALYDVGAGGRCS